MQLFQIWNGANEWIREGLLARFRFERSGLRCHHTKSVPFLFDPKWSMVGPPTSTRQRSTFLARKRFARGVTHATHIFRWIFN